MNHADIRALCLQLPGAEQSIKWQENRVFTVADKMFCIMHVDPAVRTALSLKADPARFLELTDQPGIVPAPYLARHHWVSLEHPAVVPADVLAELITTSYQLVRAKLPRRVRDALPPI